MKRRQFLTLAGTITVMLVNFKVGAWERGSRIYYVSPSGDDKNNGLSPSTAFRSIRHAVYTASARDQVIVMAGTYVEKPFILTRMPQSKDVEDATPSVSKRTLTFKGEK